MAPLDKLIEAVEAGIVTEYTRDTGLNIDALILVEKSLNGSLDAALALHQALLPGPLWITLTGGFATISHDGDEYTGGETSPARAWLLAILRAYRGMQQ